jgi:SsrA-binding protein
MSNKIVAKAKKNFHDYEIDRRFFAGLVLTGDEIKSIRMGQVSISESYVSSKDSEIYISNMIIPPYKKIHTSLLSKKDFRRKIKLLLNRREINNLLFDSKSKGLSIIPLQLFINEKG